MPFEYLAIIGHLNSKQVNIHFLMFLLFRCSVFRSPLYLVFRYLLFSNATAPIPIFRTISIFLGLLITFIELIKNPTYNFWKHEFVHCAPEIQKLFESVARSCMVPSVPRMDLDGQMAD